MKVGDVMRVKRNQDCTLEEARGQLCIIEILNDRDSIQIRLQGKYIPTHYTQHVNDYHLEAP